MLFLVCLICLGCNFSSQDEVDNDNLPQEDISIEELALLNKQVKNGETTCSRTLEIYKTIVDSNYNAKDIEGPNILRNALAGETLDVLKEQINEELEKDPIQGIEFLEKLFSINPNEEIIDWLNSTIDSTTDTYYAEGKLDQAYEVINKRFRYGFEMDAMDLRIKIGIELVDKLKEDGNADEAESIINELENIINIPDNIALKEKYADQLSE